jgi:phosphoribosylformylglycinamidine cyclo-ligase
MGSWEVHPIFDYLEKEGRIEKIEMHNVFNMGIGMVVCVAENQADAALNLLEQMGETAVVMGDIIKNPEGGLVYV